jgi:tellurite resistance protein TerC
VTIGAVVALLALDFLITRRPHEVTMREALSWSAFYVAIPVGLRRVALAASTAARPGLEFYTGYLVEKSLSVDNLFIFLLLLTAFAVPQASCSNACCSSASPARSSCAASSSPSGAQLIASFSWAFLLFGAILLATASQGRSRRGRPRRPRRRHRLAPQRCGFLRRFWPVSDDLSRHRACGPPARQGSPRLTPMALVIVAILVTDIVFAIDSVPAVYGITEDPYLVFATNAFALLGLRALYFVLAGASRR